MPLLGATGVCPGAASRCPRSHGPTALWEGTVGLSAINGRSGSLDEKIKFSVDSMSIVDTVGRVEREKWQRSSLILKRKKNFFLRYFL